jgi:hypothetical protein
MEDKARQRDEEKHKKMQDVCRKMDALAKKVGNGTSATIRRFRNSNLKGGS